MFWVEIHCDADREERSGFNEHFRAICNSDAGLYPASMGSTASEAARHAAKVARSAGWKRSSGKWLCPGCIKHGLEISS